MKRIYLITAVILISVLCLPAAYGGEYGTVHPVSIITDEREGEMDISLKNRTAGRYTVTVFFKKLINAESDKPLPYTMVIGGMSAAKCLTVRQVDRNSKWDTFFMYDFQPGVVNAVHDDYIYSLPYRGGEGYRVMQGYKGKYTHKGEFTYSIDWDMPLGTEVLAARDGVVSVTEDSFQGHGLKPYYYERNNFVIIEHSDGTVGRYVHFRQKGVKVKPGDKVAAGDLIGLSGDVGYSNAPHLHFSVHRPLDGKRSESLPVKFRISEKEIIELQEGKTYMRPQGR